MYSSIYTNFSLLISLPRKNERDNFRKSPTRMAKPHMSQRFSLYKPTQFSINRKMTY